MINAISTLRKRGITNDETENIGTDIKIIDTMLHPHVFWPQELSGHVQLSLRTVPVFPRHVAQLESQFSSH